MFYAFILFFALYDSFLSESFLISPNMPSGQGYCLTIYTNYSSEWLLKTLLLRRETLTHVKKVNL